MAIIERDEDGVITALNIFGYNMAKVVCFKTSALVGFGVMIPSCVGYVYWTGKTGRLLEVALISYWGAFFPFFHICRYKYDKTKFELEKTMSMYKELNLRKGTAEDIRYKGLDDLPEDIKKKIKGDIDT